MAVDSYHVKKPGHKLARKAEAAWCGGCHRRGPHGWQEARKNVREAPTKYLKV